MGVHQACKDRCKDLEKSFLSSRLKKTLMGGEWEVLKGEEKKESKKNVNPQDASPRLRGKTAFPRVKGGGQRDTKKLAEYSECAVRGKVYDFEEGTSKGTIPERKKVSRRGRAQAYPLTFRTREVLEKASSIQENGYGKNTSK